MRKQKRFLRTLFLVALFVGSLLTFNVSAKATNTVPDGFVGIYNVEDLDSIRNNLSGNFILMNNIDLAGWGNWTPIGPYAFTGTFDGNGYAIENMVIDDSSVIKDYSGGYQYAGLFATLNGATVKNIRYISGTISTEKQPCLRAGAIAADAYGSTISRCTSYVNIGYHYGDPTEQAYTGVGGVGLECGGIVGLVMDIGSFGETSITESSNYGAIVGISESAPMVIGGIVGDNFVGECNIKNCYNAGNLSVNTGYVSGKIGGIIGHTSKGEVSYCYNSGSLSLTCPEYQFDRKYVGGIAGEMNNSSDNKVSYSYYVSDISAAVGSVRVWTAQGTTIHCTVRATEKSGSAMQKQSTYSSFDFSTVWKMGDSDYPYPVLRWTVAGDSSCSHKYTSATGNTCTVCGYEFEPKLTAYSKTLYVAKDIVPVRDNYYSKSNTVVETLTKGTAVKVTHKLQNALGNEWYVTDSGKYIYAKNLTATAPNAHTLTFNANGGTGAPAAVTTVATKYGLPSTKPKRNGYTFLGWSTNKNATTEEYKAGQAVSMTKDLTLYAVWEENVSSLSDLSPEVVAALNSTTGIAQVSDKCTKCATATLLKRRQVAEGKTGTFTLADIESGSGYSAIYPGGNTYKSNGDVYRCTVIQPEKITSNRTELVLNLLDAHPEGIVIYCTYRSSKKDSQHAIVLSDYEKDSDGNYTIYAYDPNDGTNRIKLEETSLYKGCNNPLYGKYMKATSEPSYENVFANFKSGSCGCIWYVRTEE